MIVKNHQLHNQNINYIQYSIYEQCRPIKNTLYSLYLYLLTV